MHYRILDLINFTSCLKIVKNYVYKWQEIFKHITLGIYCNNEAKIAENIGDHVTWVEFHC